MPLFFVDDYGKIILPVGGYCISKLKTLNIIFICPFEPFDKGRHIYTFRNRCSEDTKMELDDGMTKMFLNTKGTMDDVDEEVKAFLNYVDGIMSEDKLVQEIDHEIQKVKMIEQERVGYMTFIMKMHEG